ncbi:MAG: hypothetical protein ABS935_11330 [Solibacillus sp.]|uniref:hypothetical protein n=1 Tax=Solibacillus sp. TaxID=1909654 RepID=UPI00331618AE
MKNLTKLIFCNFILLFLFGCSVDPKEEKEIEGSNNNASIGVDAKVSEEAFIKGSSSVGETNENEGDSNSNFTEENLNADDSSKGLVMREQKDSTDNNKKENRELSKYSPEQIEYARVWLQLGPNQEIDELYVKEISEGTLLNPEDNMSVKYPEDVVQLTGSRLVDGIVTYSSNGDGTINVYNVPLRWYGGFTPPKDIDKEKVHQEMEDIINNTKKVYIHPNNEEKIIALIKKIKTN